MSTKDDGRLPDAIRAIAVDAAAGLDVDVLEVEVKGQAGRRSVVVTADAADLDADAGLDIDTIATLSRRIEEALDAQDPVAGSYTLTVTSPGADRPLRRPRDFARNRGRTVRLVRVAEADGADELTGTLRAVTDQVLTLEVDGAPVEVALAEVDHGKVVLPW